MNKIHYPIRIKPFGTKGLGVEACRYIPEHSIVMENITKHIEIDSDDIDFGIAQFLFVNPAAYMDNNQLYKHIMVCGEMVFLNHDDVPNCSVDWRYDADDICFALLVSRRAIEIGEELTIRYTDVQSYRKKGYI